MKLPSLFFLLSITALVSCNQKPELGRANPIVAQLDSLIETEHKENLLSGTIVVGTTDSIIFQKAIGTANRVWNIPLRINHRFDICSINKSFVATLVLLAFEEGKLKPTDRLVDLLKSYQYSGKFDSKITMHQMLSHTSGLPDYGGVSNQFSQNNFRVFKRQKFTNDQYVNFISEIPAVNQPGSQFYYSNFAYHLLPIILENVYQQSFSELVQEKICQPLGLKDTFSSTSNLEVHTNMVEAYNYQKNDSVWKRNEFIDLSLGRRIFSTTTELFKWGNAMSNNTLLSSKSLELMQTNHLTDVTTEISYGYGWVVFDGNSIYRMGNLGINENYIIHGGNTEGFKAMLVNIEKGTFIIAILTNSGDQVNEMLLTQKIARILTNEKYEN